MPVRVIQALDTARTILEPVAIAVAEAIFVKLLFAEGNRPFAPDFCAQSGQIWGV